MRKIRKEERAQAIEELMNSGKGEAAVYVCVVLQHRIPCAFVGCHRRGRRRGPKECFRARDMSPLGL